MKTLMYAVLLIVTNISILFTQQTPRAEIFIMNRDLSKDIFVRVIPVGFVFNMRPLESVEDYDNLAGFVRDYRYSAEADHDYPNKDNYIFAGSKRLLKSVNGSQNDPQRGFFFILGCIKSRCM
ncbi:MAG TPA: hypothetical protein PK850_03995 [Ignavibacteria bacterium]|nr:hypothetical protein [Ignavibacteria bacterium]HRF65096.1 hypothetical protein [Ignavibacteria bacterium]